VIREVRVDEKDKKDENDDQDAGDPIARAADAQAALLGLRIDPAHRPGTIASLAQTAAMVALLMDFPLPPGVEPAPVFSPLSRDGD
jgi:hypothetical protein